MYLILKPRKEFLFASAALIGGLVSAGTTIYGDVSASSGQSAANAANQQMNDANIAAAMNRQTQAEGFNQQEAAVSRQFSAQQVQQQEQFQRDTLKQAEDYNTEMSNTAMQRRVADLQKAGINPLLAVSQGGASTPTMSGMSGGIGPSAQASAGPGGQGSGIPMQNTQTAWGNLGAQLNSALQLQQTGAQIDLLKAQADKTRAESNTEIPAQVDYLKSMTGLNDQQAQQAYTNTQLLQQKIYGQRLDNDQLRDITMPMGQQNLMVVKGTRDALISAAQSDATAKQLNLAGLRNLNDVQSGNLGLVLTYLNSILQPISTAAKIK